MLFESGAQSRRPGRQGVPFTMLVTHVVHATTTKISTRLRLARTGAVYKGEVIKTSRFSADEWGF